MGYRCKYRTSDKVVVGVAIDAPAGHFDDADHGTTIEFSGALPSPFEKIYDDTPPEALDPNPDYGAWLDVTTTATDTDGDGIPDIAGDNVATATIEIKKKDANGTLMNGAGDNDQLYVEASAGKLNVASLSLSAGEATLTLQASDQVGRLTQIIIRSARHSVRAGAVGIKYR